MTVGRRAIASVGRLNSLVDQHDSLKTDATALLDAALIRGEFERGAAAGLTALPENRAARLERYYGRRPSGLLNAQRAGLIAISRRRPRSPVSPRYPQT
jgi:hypothetical protein